MTAPRKRRVFPFTAVIGQEEMKLALLLNVIDPRIGGVMIMGDRGTGKSTTIRALADLLPDIDVVAGDPYNSSATDPDLQSSEVRERLIRNETVATEQRQVPMVDLPLGATEDRLCGTIDIEKALSEGVRAFEPGLLAKANRGLLLERRDRCDGTTEAQGFPLHSGDRSGGNEAGASPQRDRPAYWWGDDHG